ncbi:MAG: right-handed parallel beta-helix repeat-containing protein, partial [Planctomycetota bacterium]|nr:right-handed parallel beta-helix repeat-containing protein [Planctomycetota bacterium]
MYLRRGGNRTSRRQPSIAARRLDRTSLLLEPLEPRRLLTTNDLGDVAALDIHDPQFVVAQGEMTAPVAPVISGTDLLTFYDYNTQNSAASNTGYEASNRVTFLFHEDPDQALGFVVLVDAPQDDDGGTISLDISGLDAATIVVADEPLEQTSSSDSTLFARSWNAQASDGAAFSNLGDNFSFVVETNYLFGIDGFDVINGTDGSRISIPLTDQPWEIYEEYGLEISAVPNVIAENSASLTATITRGGAVTEDLLVQLQCSADSRVQVPQSVLIPAGSQSAEFTVDLIDNTLPYDAESIVLTASADHYRSAESSFDLIDDDLPLLDVGIDAVLYDFSGMESSSGYLLSGTTATHVVHITNTQNVVFSHPTVFGDNQTPDDSRDDFMYTPHRTAQDTNVGDLNNNYLFDPGEVWKFSTAVSVELGQNISQVYCGAIDPIFDVVLSPGVSAGYFGVLPSLAMGIDSAISGEGGEQNGEIHAVAGNELTVHYQLHNTGNTGLGDVEVGGATYIGGDINDDGVLDVNETWTFSDTAEALAGSQTLSAAVTARDALTGTEVSGTASGSYFGAVVDLALDHSLSSAYVLSGDTVGVTYTLHNTGNTGLGDVEVGGATYIGGDINDDGVLDVNETWTFSDTAEALAGSQTLSAAVTARDALTGTEVSGTASGSYFGAVVDWIATSAWDMEIDTRVPELIVGESFRISYYLQNLGDVELTDVTVANANPVFSGQFIEGDLDEDGRIDPQEIWKFEHTGTVALGDQTQQVTVAATTTDFDVSLSTNLQDAYQGYYRSLAVTHTGDSGIGSLRYVLQDVASRPEGGVIYFDLSEEDPGFVDIDSDLPGGDAAADIFLIQPQSALPALQGTGPIELIGGVNGIPVVIDGSFAGNSHGLEILSDGNQVKGLTIQNFALSGIRVLGTGNIISGNKIGIDSAGQQAGNGGDGIWVDGGSQNLIGGQDEEGADQNIIAYNGGNGISVENGTINQINTNAFYENAGMGIDLGRNGFTPNDVEDGSVDDDSGANELINTPVITRIELVNGVVEVDYYVPTNADAIEDSLRIEFYRADASRREGGEFLGTDIYTSEDFQRGGKTLTVDVDEYPDLDSRIVATATSSRAGTSEFSAPRGIRFEGRAVEEEQQDLADDVANGILAQLEAYLSGQAPTPLPIPTPGQPVVAPDLPVHDVVVADSGIDEILIGRNVVARDASDCALNVGSGDDPLVAIGFGEEVDDVTMAVNDYCVEQVYDLADSLSLTPGQMVAVIWFDPINFTVTIGDNQVSYDYDNNPTELAGSIPGASLVVTSASSTTPGGVQGIMFAGDASTINVQMSTTSSGELMRGGVNIYTVGTGAGGTTIQPSIRTVFQGHLPGESVMMAFDPSAAPQMLVRGGNAVSQSVA